MITCFDCERPVPSSLALWAVPICAFIIYIVIRCKTKAVLVLRLICYQYSELWNSCFRFRWANGTLPADIRLLDTTINEDQPCGICLEELGGRFHDEVVLRCGHRFHFGCISQWERSQYLEQIKNFCSHDPCHIPKDCCAVNPKYECPLCKGQYSWQQRWSSNFIRR